MSIKPTGKIIAQALGISEGRVSQLKRDGMPVDDIEAARSWYRRRVDPARAFGQRHRYGRTPSPSAPSAVDPLERVAVLAERAERMIAVGQPLDSLEEPLREALLSVPESEIPRVELPSAVWFFLCREVLEVVREFEAAPGGHPEEAAQEEHTLELDRFWYQVAAGFIVVTRPA